MHFTGNAREDTSCTRRRHCPMWVVAVVLVWAGTAAGQICLTSDEMDAATRNGLEAAGRRYFDWTAKGDVETLRQNAIPGVASDFGGIESAVKDSQTNFAGAQALVRPPFLLQAEGQEPLPRAEFLCGVFGKTGQTAHSAVFVIPNLPPGDYGVAILDVAAKLPSTLSLVLQRVGNDWKLGGFYSRPTQVGGHDGAWFRDRAREFEKKGQNRNAWLYYLKARDLVAPVPFMSTLETDKIYDESQPLQPPDTPSAEVPVEISGGGKVYRVTSIFPVGIDGDVDLVVKYQSPSVSNTNQTYQDNLAAIRALVAKYPEYRDGFTAIIARAVEPSGKDYGTMLAVKDIK
jgi:hypothetical protein